MVSSFHPHSMCEKVERVTEKTGCTSCTKRTICFEVSRFHTETHVLQRDFIFLNLFELHSFYVFKMHHSKPHHQFTTLSDFICYFSCIYPLLWAIRPWNWKAFVTGCTSCTKRTISFEVWGFHTETRLLQRDFIFLTYLNSILFVCSKCTIQRHITKFQQFLTSFGILRALTYYFFELVDPEIEKHYKWTLKMLKFGMLSSFHPHSMC